MDIVLGVSMTPTAVRMALVEGERADGVTLDQDSFDVAPGVSPAMSDAPEQVVAAILGTRESAAESAHRLVATGVAWVDHAAAARVRQALRAQRIEDVILVSELHAASALAQAVGRAVDYERTALLFLERDNATLAVVRTGDGAVVRVATQRVDAAEPMADLQAMLAGLQTGAEAPQALFMVGSGLDAGFDIAALTPQIAALIGLPVHAPEEGELALARGAALAAANTPRYEAATVGLLSRDDTAAGPTQMAAAGYMAPLGYSAVSDDDLDLFAEVPDEPEPKPERAPFVLLGSAVSTIFVIGVAALAVALAVAIRPTADQRPVPGDSAVVSNNSVQPAAPQAQNPPPPAAPAPETIQAPIPVVQEVPRTVYVTPKDVGPAPAPAPAAPPPAPEPAAAAPPPAAPAPAPAPAAPPPPPPAAPAPAPAPAPAAPPIVVPIPIIPPPVINLPPLFQVPRTVPTLPSFPSYPTYAPRTTQSAPAPWTPSPTTAAPAPATQAPATAYPTYTPSVTTVAPSRPSRGSSGSGSGSSDGSQTIWPPLWPFGD